MLARCSEERWDSALDMPKMPELEPWPQALRLDTQMWDSLRPRSSVPEILPGVGLFSYKSRQKTLNYRHKCSYSSNSPQFKILSFVHIFKSIEKNPSLNHFSSAWRKCPHSSVCLKLAGRCQSYCCWDVPISSSERHILLPKPLRIKSDFCEWHGYICTTSTFCCKNRWIWSCFVHCF